MSHISCDSTCSGFASKCKMELHSLSAISISLTFLSHVFLRFVQVFSEETILLTEFPGLLGIPPRASIAPAEEGAVHPACGEGLQRRIQAAILPTSGTSATSVVLSKNVVLHKPPIMTILLRLQGWERKTMFHRFWAREEYVCLLLFHHIPS